MSAIPNKCGATPWCRRKPVEWFCYLENITSPTEVIGICNDHLLYTITPELRTTSLEEAEAWLVEQSL
jgi:hypothetical protein